MIAIIFNKKVFQCHSNHGNHGFSGSQASRHPQGGPLLSQGSKGCGFGQMTTGGLQLSSICLGTLNCMASAMPYNSTMMLAVIGIAAAVAVAIAAATVADIIITSCK
jgi:hypothetical protein